MKFYQLLQAAEFSPVWDCLQSYYDVEDRLFDGYKKAFEELRNTVPAETEDEILLVVAKLHAEEIGEEGYFYDVNGFQLNNRQQYGLMLVPWEEWLSFEVLSKSITLYGQVACVAHSLYELTYYGFSNASAKAKIEGLFLSPASSERGNAKKLAEALDYVDERTEEDKRLEAERWRIAKEANKQIYASLLADSDIQENDCAGN